MAKPLAQRGTWDLSCWVPARPWGVPTRGCKEGSSCSQRLESAPLRDIHGLTMGFWQDRVSVSVPRDPALTALCPCPQAFCDDASGLKFNPVLYPKVR